MELGLIGLGKMGGNMRERIRQAGHTVVGYDRSPDVTDVGSLKDLVGGLSAPRVVWVMVPAGPATQSTIDELGELLAAGDVVVDGGNSRWTDDKKHAEHLATKGIGFVDAGVSGGVWGLKNGYALMVGGDAENVAKAQPIFDALKPEGEFGFVHAGRRRRGPLLEDGPQRHRVRDHAGLRRGLGAARGSARSHRRARGLPLVAGGHRHPLLAAGSGRGRPRPGPSTCQSCAATPRTPAKAAGPSKRPSTTPCRCR